MNSSLGRQARAHTLCVAIVAGYLSASAARADAGGAPRDSDYPGVITLDVDASDVAHSVFKAHETIPVAPGPLTLLYPQWLPGNHSPTGPIDKLADLTVTAGGQTLAWTRDPADVFAFQMVVPNGVTSLNVDLEFLSAVTSREGRVMMTPDMLSLQWNTVLLYPAGYPARRITVRPSVTVPAGFSLATALDITQAASPTTTFKPTDLETLVDSPLVAGRHVRRYELDPTSPTRVTLDVFADRPAEAEATAAQIAAHVALVQQSYKLFQARHFDHYDFLVTLSERLGTIGLEHQQSSENGTGARYLADWEISPAGRDLLAHEFAHSWNGKFRRPADLITPDYNTPMRGSLLWVYEGQTQYWGYVLTARSGMLSRQDSLDAIAAIAAAYDHRAGREWRPLQDTTNDPVIAMRRPLPWVSWQRSEDYYAEGALIWLDVDTLIRQQSGGKRSLDDFAQRFFADGDGVRGPRAYEFSDIVEALNAVQPYDWAGFLNARLQSHGPDAPLDGLTRGGYRLVYTENATPYFKSLEAAHKATDFLYSIGLSLTVEGHISEVLWDGPAFKAGLSEGQQIIAVNGAAYSPSELAEAISEAKTASGPIELLLRDQDTYRTVRVEYHGGMRYPRLERIPTAPPLLDDILTARR